MTQFAYLFERFPSFGQTFCYREVAELARQGIAPPIFSIRNPKDEPPQEWDQRIVKRVHYLPEERELLNDVRRTSKKGKLTAESIAAIDEWGRRTDFLRLYQAVYIGLRLQEMGIPHVHAHFAGMAARTAFWIHKFFPITFSFTAHANDIFTPRDFEIGLDKLFSARLSAKARSSTNCARRLTTLACKTVLSCPVQNRSVKSGSVSPRRAFSYCLV